MKIMLTVMLLSVFCSGTASSLQPDSIVSDSTQSRAHAGKTVRFTTRLHSSGFFNLSGRICSPTPAADLNFLAEKKGYGFSVFTVRDLYDKRSDNNFSFGIIYKRIALSKRFSVTPNVGVVMDDFGDAFGDRMFIVSAFKVSSRLTIDETSLFANALNRREQKEWINRIRFIYSQTNQLQFILSNWHNNTVFDGNGYLSGSFQAVYHRIRLSDHMLAQTGVSFFVMAKNTTETPKQEKSGLLFTFALSLE